MSPLPLIVSLNGCLIKTDTLHEVGIQALRTTPLNMLRLPAWITQGKGKLKQKLTESIEFDVTHLPYHQELIAWLKQQKETGRKIILFTASDVQLANAIALHLDLFDEVIANESGVNRTGAEKAQWLETRFGRGGFDYVGHSSSDLPIWQCAKNAILVNASTSLTKKIKTTCEVERVFETPQITLKAWAKMLRVHQWLKNALLFVPLFAAHQIFDWGGWFLLILAFISFSLCASSVYITNDLLDLENDRQHPRKCKRPFASGTFPVYWGGILAPLLLITAFILAQYIGSHFMEWLLLYFVVTSAYSLGLKRWVIIDCVILSGLYTLRILAGAAAANLPLSLWLLAFSAFLFLSLAFVKRYAELCIKLSHHKTKIRGRGYYTTDAPLVQTFGVASGYAAVLVLALYLNSSAVAQLYPTPEMAWGVVPVMLFWISWIWLKAHRGEMHDDPLVFAVKDKHSLFAGALFVILLAFGSFVW